MFECLSDDKTVSAHNLFARRSRRSLLLMLSLCARKSVRRGIMVFSVLYPAKCGMDGVDVGVHGECSIPNEYVNDTN